MITQDKGPSVVTLGTAGGPRWWGSANASPRSGIATAIVVGDAFYLVDCGHGVGRRLEQAGLRLDNLQAMFITHMHSDHTVDLASLVLFGLYELAGRANDPVRIIGPGNRGMLPLLSPQARQAPEHVAPRNPTPGTREMFELLVRAHAADLNERILDGLRPSPLELFRASDIRIPEDVDCHPNDNPTPLMRPFPIYEDDRVKVSAILVEHPPVFPAFGFRFETDGGSVTFSGDTCYTPNMVTLAENTDLLLHEAIDVEWIESVYGGKTDETSRASRDHHFKSHTSVAEAAKVAAEAGARQLALHHLVPGSAGNAVWQQATQYFEGRFHLPQDLDSIPLRPDC